ncbi:MAG: hypothetical protein U5N55_04790 [Cypionkella sp.]|nr:hypothetical protein [Cypionkella sp.]
MPGDPALSPCDLCGAAQSGYGYGYPGHRKDRKSNATLCSCRACIPAAEIRWQAGLRKDGLFT